MAPSPEQLLEFCKTMDEKMKKSFVDFQYDEFVEESLRRFSIALEEEKKLTEDNSMLAEFVGAFRFIKTYRKMNSWICFGCFDGFTEFSEWISHISQCPRCCDFDTRILLEHPQQCKDIGILDNTMVLSSDLQLKFQVVKNRNGVRRVKIHDFDTLMKLLCNPCNAIPKPDVDFGIPKTNWDLLCGILKREESKGKDEEEEEEEEEENDPTIKLLKPNIIMRLDRRTIMCLLEKTCFYSHEKLFVYALFAYLKQHLEREYFVENMHEFSLEDPEKVRKKKKKNKKKKKKPASNVIDEDSEVEAEAAEQDEDCEIKVEAPEIPNENEGKIEEEGDRSEVVKVEKEVEGEAEKNMLIQKKKKKNKKKKKKPASEESSSNVRDRDCNPEAEAVEVVKAEEKKEAEVEKHRSRGSFQKEDMHLFHMFYRSLKPVEQSKAENELFRRGWIKYLDRWVMLVDETSYVYMDLSKFETIYEEFS